MASVKKIPIHSLLRQAAEGWINHNDSRLAAAIAYYTIFSLAPLLVIVVAVAGAVFGEAAARGELSQRIVSLVGEDALPILEGMIEGASRFKSGLFAWAVGAIALFVGATGVFAAIRDALATIWEVPSSGGLRAMVRTRITSFVVVLAMGVLLLSLVLMSTILSVITRLTGIPQFLDLANSILTFAIVTCLVAFIYKVLGSMKMRWRAVWTGAAVTSLLFTVGKLLIGYYLASSRMRSAYGAASSVIVLLFWIYFSAQVFLFGAEFIQAYNGSDGETRNPSAKGAEDLAEGLSEGKKRQDKTP
jgi:membrane protein